MVSIFVRTAVIYLLLAISLKIMGKRQIGELEVGELVSTLLISEIVSIPINTPDIPLLNAIIPLFLILAVEILTSYVKNKSGRLKRAIEGNATFIIYNGKLRQKELVQNRISVNEILTEMRIQGIGDINDVKYCILESSGKLSFFQKENDPLTLPLITDGEFEEENAVILGISKEWVDKKLKCDGKEMSDVFLMTADASHKHFIIYKEENV